MKTCFGLLLTCILLSAGAQQDLIKEIDSLNELSYQRRLGESNSAIKLAKEAIRLNENGAYEKGLYDSYRTLGINYTNLSRYDSAITLLRLCEEYYDYSFEKGLVKYYLGINYSNLSSFSKAIEYFDEALAIFEEFGSHKYSAYVYNSLGIIEGRQANYDEALELFLKAYDIKLGAEFPYDEELSNISIVYRRSQKPEKALEFSKKSLKMAVQLGDSLGVAESCIGIGNIFKDMDQPDSSIWYYDRSYDIAERMSYSHQMASATINKAGILKDLNQTDNAILLLTNVIGTIDGDQYLEESIYNELAQVYYGTEQYDQSIKNGLEAYKRSVSNNNLALNRDISLLIANSFKKLNKPDSALKYLAIHNGYLKEYYKENNSASISDLQVRIETLEKDHEISILTQERELERVKRERLIVIAVLISVIAIITIVLIVKRQRDRSKRQRLEKEKLKIEVEKAQEDLYKQTIHMIHVNNCLDEIEEEIRKRNGSSVDQSNKRILNSIRVNKSLDKDWQNFNDYFGNVHADFHEKLNGMADDLSNHDRRICALLKLGLSNREISTILNIESKSVSMLKYRIKKKLQLEEAVDLSNFVQSL